MTRRTVDSRSIASLRLGHHGAIDARPPRIPARPSSGNPTAVTVPELLARAP